MFESVFKNVWYWINWCTVTLIISQVGLPCRLESFPSASYVQRCRHERSLHRSFFFGNPGLLLSQSEITFDQEWRELSVKNVPYTSYILIHVHCYFTAKRLSNTPAFKLSYSFNKISLSIHIWCLSVFQAYVKFYVLRNSSVPSSPVH